MTHTPRPSIAPASAVILVLDRSGSMAAIRDNTIESLNSYIEELRDRPAPGLTFPLITFDSIRRMSFITAFRSRRCRR